MTSDVFGTAGLRRTVLAAWEASPARFREDANAEDELVRGGYRDRVVVELVQNAVDAAVAVHGRGRVRLALDGDRLTVANTGVEVDADAIAGLSSLRASTKRDDRTIGRFGVGFAAVLAVTDEPTILSRYGGVTWSRRRARAAASAIAGLAEELERRGDAVPVLRLPFQVDDAAAPPEGYDTAVVLPLRDATAVSLVRGLLTDVDDALMLAFPDLAELRIVIDDDERALTSGPAEPLAVAVSEQYGGTAVAVVPVNDRRWAVGRRVGAADPAMLADRPHEERQRRQWSAEVAVIVDGDNRPTRPEGSSGPAQPEWPSWPAQPERPVREGAQASPAVRAAGLIHAPTPTDDRTDLPALIIASFPVDSSRRRVAPGPLTDLLVTELGTAYADLLAALGTPETLDLVPMPLGAGDLDAALHRAVLDAIATTPLIPAARPQQAESGPSDPQPTNRWPDPAGDVEISPTKGGPNRVGPEHSAALRPRDVVVIDGLDGRAAGTVLADIVVGLPAARWWRPDILRRLGATVRPLADVVDDLSSVTLDPSGWWQVYDAFADVASAAELGSLPVPLVDGRVVRGPRGVVLPAGVDPSSLVALGLRVAEPAAAHPLLGRLGAVEATPVSILRDPAVRAAVENVDADQPAANAELTHAVLGLVAAAGVDVADEPWLASLPVETGAGDVAPVGELWLADTPVIGVLGIDPAADVVAAGLVERHGRAVLAAVGAADGFRVVRENGVTLDDDFWHDLDGEDEYAAYVRAGLADDDAVPPVIVEYTAIADLDLVRPDAWPDVLRLLAADQQTRAALIDPAVVVGADGTRRRLPSYTAWWLRRNARLDGRAPTELRTVDADPLVAALFAPAPVDLDDAVAVALGLARTLDDTSASAVLERLADADLILSTTDLAAAYAWLATVDPADVAPPTRIRVPDGTATRVVAADGVIVADGPFWLPVLADHEAVLAGPESLAEVLDVASASDEITVEVPSGASAPIPEVAAVLLVGAPAQYVEHDDLVIGGVDVAWWVDEDGAVHAATTDGLAAGLAWVTGRWDRRWIVAAALADPASLDRLLAEDAF